MVFDDSASGNQPTAIDPDAMSLRAALAETKPVVSGQVPAEALTNSCRMAEHTDFFDAIYRCAEDDATRVPWADLRPHPLLVQWLNRDSCGIVRPGCRAAVVGCGLGDDVAELCHRGYDVLGFDCSPTAIKWAQRRHPGIAERFVVADACDLPCRLQARFDLVVEIYTLQSVRPAVRACVAEGIGRLISPRGVAVVIARSREQAETNDDRDGPPWPLTLAEIDAMMLRAGLSSHGQARTGLVTGESGPPRLCATYMRA
jgi:SAM-dependent methyltransferase